MHDRDMLRYPLSVVLDNVMVMNLERREDKYNFLLGALYNLGFDCFDTGVVSSNVIRFLMPDGLDYDNYESVCEDAIKDGFPEFEFVLDGVSDVSFYPFITPYVLCWSWGWRSALRNISDVKDNNVLLLIDDCIPKSRWSYQRFCSLLEVCHSNEHGFRIVQLINSIVADEIVSEDVVNVHDSMLAKGFSGSSAFGTLLNGDGASFLLDFASDYPLIAFCDLFREVARTDGLSSSGFWHTVDDICSVCFHWKTDLFPD